MLKEITPVQVSQAWNLAVNNVADMCYLGLDKAKARQEANLALTSTFLELDKKDRGVFTDDEQGRLSTKLELAKSFAAKKDVRQTMMRLQAQGISFISTKHMPG